MHSPQLLSERFHIIAHNNLLLFQCLPLNVDLLQLLLQFDIGLKHLLVFIYDEVAYV